MTPKPHSGPEFTWEDIEGESRMVFRDLDELESFLNWRSGRLEEQLRTTQEALAFYADPKTYEEGVEPHPRHFATGITPILEDLGAKAREASCPARGPEL